jgi:hypothetical protein
MALSFHRVRECIAAKIFSYMHIQSTDNPADLLSKHWGYSQVWEMLKLVLFFRMSSSCGIFTRRGIVGFSITHFIVFLEKGE